MVTWERDRVGVLTSDSVRHRGDSLSVFFSLASTSAGPLSRASVRDTSEVRVKSVQEPRETILAVLYEISLGIMTLGERGA